MFTALFKSTTLAVASIAALGMVSTASAIDRADPGFHNINIGGSRTIMVAVNPGADVSDRAPYALTGRDNTDTRWQAR
ncbi:MAG: hypothetical protein H7144_02510 [Burkholderiales bacterium]|nr:hypothetical protein [Phycisphaerae bacterium]